MMKQPEMHDAICARGSALCVHMITCICMFVGGGQLISQLFTESFFIGFFFGLVRPRLLSRKGLPHAHAMQAVAHMETAAVNQNFLFFFFKCPVKEAPGWSPLFQCGTQQEAREKVHSSSWKQDDSSMCSFLTGDP